MTPSKLRPAISLFTAVAFLSAQLAPLGAVAFAAQSMSRADYEACQARDEATFRTAVETITTRAMRAGLAGVDYAAAVDDAWRRRNMSKVLDAQVDKVVKDVREESSWGQLVKSLASKARAKKLATTVATRVYRSDKVKKAIEALAADVGTSVAKRIELATADAAEPARKCMQAFLGARFGNTIAGVVGRDTSEQLEVDASNRSASVTTGQVVLRSSGGLAGAMVLIVRRQLSKIAARIGQRVLGAILSRLVSVVAGGIGIVLIAKDIWEMRHGVLPIIADEMKSKATMAKVRHELASAIKEQMSGNIDKLGAKSADKVVQIWHEFRAAHSSVLDLAERHDKFKTLLNTVPGRQLAQLDEVVALTLADEGEKGVLARLDDGSLDEAVKRLPRAAMQIARDTRSLEKAFQWRTLAGDKIGDVIAYEIHRKASPSEFTRNGLHRILALKDRLAITRLVGLKPVQRQSLFELEPGELTSLARALTRDQLVYLSRYLTGLGREASQRLLYAIAANPSKMEALATPRVRNALLSSADQLAAVNMMVRGDHVFDLTTFIGDLRLLRQLKVSPWLMWERYPGMLSALMVVGLLFVLMLWRLLIPRRPKVIVQMPPNPNLPAGPGHGGGDGAPTNRGPVDRGVA